MTDENTKTEQDQAAATKAPAAKKPAVNKRKKALVILMIIVIAGGWSGLRMFIKSKTHVETDNAFIEARILPVSSRVSGTVARVLVNDNQFVKQGQLLLEIDQS
ncbi:MAG: biotin/lipoyl-binding protein, partial [Steroidobacteraceae bacterium]|nr:biotin/lipoyl-binding protein [Deltaproteobacteria bacterium]